MASLVEILLLIILVISLVGDGKASRNYARQYYLLGNYPAILRNYYASAFSYKFSQLGSSEAISPRQSVSPLSGLYNNRYSNSIVSPIILNPNALNGFLSSFDPCYVPNGPSGICVLATACNLIGGQATGSCELGRVCCVNTISECSGIATLNNTYFQPPTYLSSYTPCSLTIKLDKRLYEQKYSICQVRLDFLSFTIAQPAPGGNTAAEQAQATQCLTDNFKIDGTLNTIPNICGENSGQHMYLHVTPSDVTPSNVKLTFNLGSSNINRSWKIKIAMLACGSDTLAPEDCLQYFMSATGTVSSFNWIDDRIDGNSVRQLANQNYRVCFRTEKIDNNKAKEICFSECSVSNGGEAFLLSTKGETGAARSGGYECADDYIFIANGVNAIGGASADRLCGNYINAAKRSSSTASSITVCSQPEPFALRYSTDGSEKFDLAAAEATEANNSGFCLRFQQNFK